MSLLDETWLKNTLPSLYPEHKIIHSHLITTCNKFTALRPTIAKYASSNQTREYLLLLIGTIDINYHQAIYNIPIKIWIPRNYPKLPPIPIVDPTPEMQVQVSFNVNKDGYFMHNYLAEWPYKPYSSTLIELIYIMQTIFSSRPPVLTKPPPPIPPRLYLLNKNDNRNRSFPPTAMETNSLSKPQFVQMPTTASPTVSEPELSPSLFQTPTLPALNTRITQSLLDSDEPIGDIPQLQIKLYNKLRLRFEEVNMEFEKIRQDLELKNQRLNANAQKLKRNLPLLENLSIQMDNNIAHIQATNHKLELACKELEQYGEVQIENLRFDKHTLHEQLIELIAEENAYEDTFYHLTEALNLKRIEFKAYIKAVRTLAHEQFMTRALLQKVKRKLFIP